LLRKTVSGVILTLVLISMLTLAFNIQPAEALEPPATEWSKTYGGTNDDDGISIVQTADGGYALAGWTNSYGAGGNDFWLVKTDASGNTQWSRTYGGTADDYANALVQTSDGGYALAGLTNSYGAGGVDFWLVKADSSGNLQWSKTYGGTKTDIANTLIQTADGGYALGGMTVSYCNGEADFWLVKTDANGNTQWTHAYGGTGYEQGQSLVQTVDGGYALAGWTNSYGAGADDMWLVRTDSAGNLQWSKTYGGTWYDEAYALVRTIDGGYALAGDTCASVNSVTDFLLVKTDSAGNTQWTQTYGGAYDNAAFALVQTVDGGYALAGHTWMGPPLNTWDFWLVKTDSAGNAQWNKNCGGADTDIARALVQTSDGGYALAGYTKSFGAGNSDFWLVKVNSGLPPPTYSLTITASIGGTTSPAPGTYQIGAGGVVSVGAFQYSGYQLDHWELDTVKVGSTNPYSVTMNTAHTLRAVFGAASSQRPIASFTYSPSDLCPVVGERITFDASKSKGATWYTWYFDDGTARERWKDLSTTTHIYQAAGTYHVLLVVENSNGPSYASKTIAVKKPPVLLVHGFHGSAWDPNDEWNVMMSTLTTAGFDAHISAYSPTNTGTVDSIQAYARKLETEVNDLRKSHIVDKVDIVAHSMGGLVSRYYMQKGQGGNCVRKLIMLETPNRGIPRWLFSFLYNIDPIVWGTMRKYACLTEMMEGSQLLQELDDIVIPGIHYEIIVGQLYWLRHIWGLDTVGVSIFDKVGHGDLIKNANVISKIIYMLNDDPEFLDPNEEDNPFQVASAISNTILPDEQRSFEIPVSSASEANFLLSYPQGNLNLTLNTPGGRLINPYTAENDSDITYHKDENTESYYIRSPEYGIWKANVIAANITEEENYALLILLNTTITLTLVSQKSQYAPFEPVPITASLANGNSPITGASMYAEILKPDDNTETVILYDDGLHDDNLTNDGTYANTFMNTSLWGTYCITVTVNGSLNNEQFTRQAFTAAWVEQYPDLSLCESDIHFSKETATEGETITINATIHNIGEADANNASILFYDGNPANGTFIGEYVTNITVGEAETASTQWNATRGTHQINALISPYNGFLELNYTNNIASRTIEVRGHDINLLTITVSKTVVGQTYEMSINVTVENEGDFLEEFNVTLYSNTTIIGKQPIGGMPNGTWTTITFTWNTSGFAKGNYTIKAYAWPVQGETDTTDNTLTDGTVFVTVAGDVTGEGLCDIQDISILVDKFLAEPKDPRWDVNCDVNDDHIIDIADISIAIDHFLQDP